VKTQLQLGDIFRLRECGDRYYIQLIDNYTASKDTLVAIIPGHGAVTEVTDYYLLLHHPLHLIAAKRFFQSSYEYVTRRDPVWKPDNNEQYYLATKMKYERIGVLDFDVVDTQGRTISNVTPQSTRLWPRGPWQTMVNYAWMRSFLSRIEHMNDDDIRTAFVTSITSVLR
jgi:hypothetical protein